MKRRLVVAFLIAFALWPALHRVLVAAYDANPWKLAGWAMYARPHFPARLALRLVEGGSERPLRELDDWEQVLAAEFIERRHSLGRLARPDALVEALLSRLGRADAVVVVLRTRYFDLETASIRQRTERETFTR